MAYMSKIKRIVPAYDGPVMMRCRPEFLSALKEAGYAMPRNLKDDDYVVLRGTSATRSDSLRYFPVPSMNELISNLRQRRTGKAPLAFMSYSAAVNRTTVKIGCTTFNKSSLAGAIAVSDRMVRRQRSQRKADVIVIVPAVDGGERCFDVLEDGSLQYGQGPWSVCPREMVLAFKRAIR